MRRRNKRAPAPRPARGGGTAAPAGRLQKGPPAVNKAARSLPLGRAATECKLVGQLRNRIRVIVARVRAGEGAHVLADLAETTEHWLKSGSLPQPLRSPAERLGTAV